jgi:hypothetical protein
MPTKTVDVTIKGISPLMMHRFPLEPIEAIEKKSITEQAEIACYRDPETKELYIPTEALQRTFVNGATFSKGKGRASLQKTVAACLFVSPMRVGLGVEKYEVDSRAVVVPATRGRVVRHRPILNKWGCSFKIEFDSDLLTENQMRRVIDDSGARVGVLEYRPEKKGPFGRFMVTEWATP